MTTATVLAREAAWRAQGAPLWFLLSSASDRRRDWQVGLGAAAAVIVLQLAVMAGWHGPAALPDLLATAGVLASMLFFAASLGLLLGLAQRVFPAAARDLTELRQDAAASSETLDAMAAGLLRFPGRRLLASLPVAVTAGLIHVWHLGLEAETRGAWLAAAVSTVLLWCAMFQIALPLLHNARLFSLLGHEMRVDVYRSERLVAFGRTALRPCLFIIALQCSYVFLLFGDGISLGRGATPLGLIAALLLVVGLFFLPLRGIRRRIRSSRDEALAAINLSLNGLPKPAAADLQSLTAAAGLLALRERVAAVSSWPLGLEGLRRLLLYVVIVPLTWVGAALMEMLIDGRL